MGILCRSEFGGLSVLVAADKERKRSGCFDMFSDAHLACTSRCKVRVEW